MTPTLLRFVLLVSCAHAMVHVFELSLPSVEQIIAAEFDVGKETMGLLGSCWRLPFGAFAFFAGWLTDRLGARRMLTFYLAGCSAMAAAVAFMPNLAGLFVAMFLMGSFASIYHPAGLAIISHATSPRDRTAALGIHGIFGSAGIGLAPFIAAAVLGLGASWRQYYLALMVPGAILAVWVFTRLGGSYDPVEQKRAQDNGATADADHASVVESTATGDEHWGAFALLTVVGAMGGFIYAALMNFLPRYLGGGGISWGGISEESMRNMLAGGVLLVGIVGQYLAGRFTPHRRLEVAMVLILAANAPPLLWMAYAEGGARIIAAAWFALVHFMHQPVYNSLVAKYVPQHRRSLGFGISNTMTFGLGSFGAAFAGSAPNDTANYTTLAALAVVAAGLAVVLWRARRT